MLKNILFLKIKVVSVRPDKDRWRLSLTATILVKNTEGLLDVTDSK